MNAVKKNTPEMPKSVVVKEKLTRKILRSVMAQFKSLPEALLELVDNAFDEFDGVHGGKHLDINIVITGHSITVENIGGKGMGIKELRNWLNWGEPHKIDAIGEYGQGGKAAMGYLGSSWVVQTKRWDEPCLWEIKGTKWDDVSTQEKSYRAIPQEYNLHKGLGYCSFEIRKLKKHRQDINRIRTNLANVYCTYLVKHKATITLNYEPIQPLQLPIYEGFKMQNIKERTPQGYSIKGWVGRLKRDTRVRGEPRVTGGMRLLRKGRLICDGEYFGHHDFRYKASLGTLIGEVELNKVPVLPNKTNFDIDSPEWQEAREVMYKVLKPHIDALMRQREEETVSREEKKRVSQVREIMIEAFKLLSKYTDPSDKFEEDRGRKRPEQKPEEEKLEAQALEELARHERKPRTPAPTGAIGKLRRLGKMPDWELRILQPDIRSEWGERARQRCLIINKNYCLYEERNGDDHYIAETAALQLAAPEDDEKFSLKEYLSEVNSLIRAFCEVYDSL